jgi:serine/threonine protein kinase
MILVKGDTANYFLDEASAKKGKFGTVWRAVRQTNDLQQDVIIKNIASVTAQNITILERLKTINSPSIAQTIEYFTFENRFYLVRPYFEGTDLKTIINTPAINKKIDRDAFLPMAASLLDALSQTHSQHIIHRDIKPSNILILHDKQVPPSQWDMSKAMIIDWEQSTLYPDNSSTRSPFALVYSPPEILLKYNYLVDPSSDLFSLGITLFHAITAKPPYADCNPEILVNLQLTYPLKQPSNMSDQLFAVLSKAAYKEPFPLPPRKLTSSKIEEILIKGLQGRYRDAGEIKSDLQAVETAKKSSSPWYKKILG